MGEGFLFDGQGKIRRGEVRIGGFEEALGQSCRRLDPRFLCCMHVVVWQFGASDSSDKIMFTYVQQLMGVSRYMIHDTFEVIYLTFRAVDGSLVRDWQYLRGIDC